MCATYSCICYYETSRSPFPYHPLRSETVNPTHSRPRRQDNQAFAPPPRRPLSIAASYGFYVPRISRSSGSPRSFPGHPFFCPPSIRVTGHRIPFPSQLTNPLSDITQAIYKKEKNKKCAALYITPPPSLLPSLP